MKKTLIFLITFFALFMFVGCDEYEEEYEEDYYVEYEETEYREIEYVNAYSEIEVSNKLNKLYLVDQNGLSLSGISYSCDNGRHFERTKENGAFYFYDYENCILEFDFPFEKNDLDSIVDNLFIEDNLGDGVRGIEYFCKNGDEGLTDEKGHFYFDNEEKDDICTFVL